MPHRNHVPRLVLATLATAALALGGLAALAAPAAATHTFVCASGTPPYCAGGPGAGVGHGQFGEGDCDAPVGSYYRGQGVAVQTGSTSAGRYFFWVGNGCYADATYRETGLSVAVSGQQTAVGNYWINLDWYGWSVGGGSPRCSISLSVTSAPLRHTERPACPMGPPMLPPLP